MKSLHVPVTPFLAGFAAATVIGLTIVQPVTRQAWRVNADSDVYRPLEGALMQIEKSASEGDCEKAAAQLRLLNKRWAEYRSGGPTPAQWWQDVIATTRPAP